MIRTNPRFRSRLAWGGIAALLAVAAFFWTLEKGNAATATVLGVLGLLTIILPDRERAWGLPWRVRALPRGLDAASVFATLLSSPGYGLNWFYGQNPYDEIVHIVSGGLCGAVFAGLLLADGRDRGVRALLLLGLGFGIALGVVWEGFEWAVRIIGDFTDTWTDIVLTAGGCAVGAALWGTGPGGARQVAAGRWRPPGDRPGDGPGDRAKDRAAPGARS